MEITEEATGQKNLLTFSYDANGLPMTVDYDGTVYYYVTNLQGDVIGIIDKDGNQLVSYAYDAWGNPLAVSGSEATTIGKHNPLRYRSYVYDAETNLHYLQSRYYDAEIGRFINADGYAATDQGFIGNNMFVYCGNNPIAREDDGGAFWNVVIGAVAGAAFGAIGTALSGGSASEILISAACGAVSGGLAATGFGGLIGQVAIGAVTSAIDSGYQNYNEYASGEMTLDEAVVGTLVDSAMGAAFGAMGFDGTKALKESNKIAKSAHKAIKQLTQKTVHPTVKKSAQQILRQSRKYLLNEIRQSVIDNVVSAVTTYGVGRAASFYCRRR
ncbi:MAG: RHS repeat-associated core domain-containing protein [Oscillospiraceae bacterium]|nr:RHS repeat-associated core domain-containing protein [Oscillospiraceae bacterium]